MTNWWYFSYFSWKIGCDTSCKLSPQETICMKCQILFSRKDKKNISKCRLLKFLPSIQSVNLRKKSCHLAESFFCTDVYGLLKNINKESALDKRGIQKKHFFLFFLFLHKYTLYYSSAASHNIMLVVFINPCPAEYIKSHAHFQFSVNQITWSRLLIHIHILNDKQCRSRSLEANWSWSTLFVKTGYIWVQQD